MSSVQNQLYARPYAEAAFHYAKQHSAVSSWSAFLIIFAEVFTKPRLYSILTDPFVNQAELVEVVTALLPGQLDPHQIFFLQILAKNHRLIYLTSIAEYFALLRDQDENILRDEGAINPVSDKEIIDTELQLKDLESVEKKLSKAEKLLKTAQDATLMRV